MQFDDPGLTTGRFLIETCSRNASRCAVRFQGRASSYEDFARDTRALARALIGAGVGKGSHVAVHMANRPEWIAAYFAIGLVGGVVVPVNTFASAAELDYILRHSDASVLLMQPHLLKHRYLDDLLDRHREVAHGAAGRIQCPALPQLRRVACLSIDAPQGAVEPWSTFLAHGDDVPDALVDATNDEVEPTDDAIIIYTSGTTANPKGVLHGHRAGVVQGIRFAELLRLDAADRLYTTYPFFWTAGIAMSLLPAFSAGACLLLQETFDAGSALAMIEAERATAVHAWPHQQKALGEHDSAADRDLSSLVKIDSAAPLARLAGVPVDSYGTAATYGMSETFTLASALPADAPIDERRGNSGLPLEGTEIRIVDPASGRPLPIGEEGEITVRGMTLMHGYYKVPPEQYLDADGFFHTQDGGFLDDAGRLHWSGRLGNMIKTGGANVSPVEIESALRKHPGVKVGVAIGVPHPTLGEAVVVCIVPTEGAPQDEDAVRRYLRENLAAYKVPKRVLFFREDEFTYTGNQKVQQAPLVTATQARLAAEGAEIDGHTYVQP